MTSLAAGPNMPAGRYAPQLAFASAPLHPMPRRRRPRKAKPRKPQQERSRETVDAILSAATQILVRKGYARTTTNEIAATAGVSVGSLYQYFPSKDAIAVELLRRNRERLAARIAARIGEMSEATFTAVVHALISTLLNDDEIDINLRRVLIERVVRTPARREAQGFEEGIESVIAGALRAYKDLIGIDDCDLAAFVLVRAVLAVVQSAVVDSPRHNKPALIDALARLVVRYIDPRRPESASRS
jgi:AcrR family transcriptional regulator